MAQLNDDNGHVRHFPLDVPGATPFERYSHPNLSDWDLMIADVMQDFMNPSPETACLYGSPLGPSIPWDKALRRLHRIDSRRFNAIASLHELIGNRSPLPDRSETQASLGDIIISEVARVYLETDSISFQAFCNSEYFSRLVMSGYPRPVRNPEKNRARFLGGETNAWDGKPRGRPKAEGMRKINEQIAEQLSSLYDGIPDGGPFTRHHYLPDGFHPRAQPVYDHLAGFYDASFRSIEFPHLSRDSDGGIKLAVDTERWRGRGAHRIPRERGRGRRCFSQPPPKSWTSIVFSGVNWGWQIPAPAMKLSLLDKKTRRRSLSRGRIQEMFDWDLDLEKPFIDGSRIGVSKAFRIKSRQRPACDNCGSRTHPVVNECTMPCGHCGGWSMGEYDYLCNLMELGAITVDRLPDEPPEVSHFAPDCPTAKNNRCKCQPFPLYHTAKRCRISCRPGCGHPDGRYHKGNAMTCTYRCCMCGIRNSHAGRDCRLKTCRCGGHHLGQQHSWNPTCLAPGCDKYLCGVHCQSCFSTDRPFEEETRKCWRCQGLDERPEVWGKEGEKKRRRWEKRVEEVRQLFLSGTNGAEEGSKGKEKDHDGTLDGTGAAQNGTEDHKTGSQQGYKSIFGDGPGQEDVCPCYVTTPVKDEVQGFELLPYAYNNR
ncbi:hypothetical protein B0T21DRAFT_371449 [Apiosordaria backusii]|uniref:Uncharacterized protein n=1 Tax=Apiosordaria backusii TaxID=314023 RepID=A0AA40B2I7_9PEZI|nr:hypothetical protein B0T21DRAFT_371449 [Apiosordaria backusii]